MGRTLSKDIGVRSEEVGSGIVPMKVANKGASALAELLEGRAAAKANLTAKARAGHSTR